MYLFVCVLCHKGQHHAFFMNHHWHYAPGVQAAILDVITRGIQRGKCMQQYAHHRGNVISLKDDVCHAIADVNGMANESLLFAVDDLDPFSDLDCVLWILNPH